jgi:hypothetical protein
VQTHLEVFETEQKTANESRRNLSENLKLLENKFAEVEKDLLSQKLNVVAFEDEYQRIQTVNAELAELLKNERLSINYMSA